MHWAECGICKDASQIPYVHNTKSKIICMGHLCLWIHPSPSSAAQFASVLRSLSSLIPGWLQDKAETVSYVITKGNFTPLEGVCSGSGIPASSQFNPYLLSMPDHSSVTNYHCWTIIIRILLLYLSPLEVFGLSQKFWGRLSWELELLWAIRRWLIQRHVLVLAQCPYFSGELSPRWLSKSNASLSSGVFFGSLPLHFWPHQTCLTYETSLGLYNYCSTNVCLFVKKAIIVHICKLTSCLNSSVFYLVFYLYFPVLCSIYLSPIFHQLLSSCYAVLFVFFCFNFCLSTCSLSFQLQSKAVRGRSLPILVKK